MNSVVCNLPINTQHFVGVSGDSEQRNSASNVPNFDTIVVYKKNVHNGQDEYTINNKSIYCIKFDNNAKKKQKNARDADNSRLADNGCQRSALTHAVCEPNAF
jgi:hypothetical protein